MSGEWENVELGDVANVRSGYAFKSSDWTDAGIPVVKIANVKSGRLEMQGCSHVDEETAARAGDFQLSAGDVLIAMTGYIGEVALVRDADLPCVLNQRVGKFDVRDDERLDSGYLFAVLTSREMRETIESLGYGSAQPNVSPSLIQEVEFPLPPLPEQRRIAKILGDLDDKIELNRKMNETLEQMARALFKSWFIDFDPVRAKMEGRTPTGMDAATAALFPDRLVDSELGLIPEGWEVKALEEVVDIARQSINPAAQPFDLFAHYSLPAFDTGRVPVRQRGDEIKSNKLLLTNGSVLISKLNPHIPRVWLPTLDPTEISVCSTEFIVAIASPSSSKEYLYCLFCSDDFQQTYQGLATGTTGSHQRIQAESLLSLLQVLPHGEVVSVFTSKMKSMVTAINQNIHQSRTLSTLRDTLLPKLVSGEVRVGETQVSNQ
ncbi:MAG: hypothetical protein RL594_16 [Bacteroidota bacterium]|jgi:type I restriction enzyme S subunit